MIIILPDNCNGLDELQSALPSFNLNSFGSKISNNRVVMTMPKFKAETNLPLNGALQLMGFQSIFSGSANLSGLLVEKDPLYVSDVIHKAYIDVNEKGTVAAAATGVVANRMLAVRRPPSVVFNANHPFIYLINSSEGILFMGKYVTPTN